MRKPCIKKSLYISQDNIGNLIFHLNSKNVCKISINIDFIKKLVLLMDGTYTEKELLEKIRKEGYDISQKSLEYILLMNMKFLIHVGYHKKNLRNMIDK